MSLFNFIITSKTNNKRSQDISSDEKINAFDIRIPFEIKIHILCMRKTSMHLIKSIKMLHTIIRFLVVRFFF